MSHFWRSTSQSWQPKNHQNKTIPLEFIQLHSENIQNISVDFSFKGVFFFLLCIGITVQWKVNKTSGGHFNSRLQRTVMAKQMWFLFEEVSSMCVCMCVCLNTLPISAFGEWWLCLYKIKTITKCDFSDLHMTLRETLTKGLSRLVLLQIHIIHSRCKFDKFLDTKKVLWMLSKMKLCKVIIVGKVV